jgi:protein subunit release factor A
MSNNSNYRAEHARLVQDHQRQLEHVQKTAEANADRSRRRMEVEINNLQSNISKLESSLAKVLLPRGDI